MNNFKERDNMKSNHLIKLPSKGRLLIFTDVHGDLHDYNKYLDKWDCNNPDFHIVIAGDFIHGISKEDHSIEILEDIMDKYKKYDNFHPLLGNHEWSHITKTDVFKNTSNGYSNQRIDFEKLIIEKKSSLEPHLSNYVKFFKSLPLYIQCENGIFITHAGPSKWIKTSKDYENLIHEEDYSNKNIYSTLCDRPNEDYTKEDVSNFLESISSDVMVVGHTVVYGFKIYGKEMILSSSFGTSNKLYLDIDLSKKISNTNELMDCLKELYG